MTETHKSERATDLLKHQHREAEALFAKIAKTEGAAAQEALAEELATKLAAHMAVEQEIFYPACAAALKDKDLLREAYEEHGVAGFELQRVLAAGGGDRTFEARVKVLKELVEHHVTEEEKELFPKVEKAMGKERLEELGGAMKTRFAAVLKAGYEGVLARGADAGQADAPPPRKRAAAKA